MQFESSTLIDASAAHIHSIYANVADWQQWDPDVKSASLDGSFVSGASGIVVPHGGPKSKIVFTRVTPNQGFVAQCKLPLCVMRFENELSTSAGATRATHRVTFEGLLAPLFGRLIGSGMKNTLPKALASLKAYAEKTAASARK
ncbi:MAG: polyketide cyclase [Betaproteobacteria bacterium]|nr:MAG: polyketide cyclase [Betaproteobacteria bacterium]TAG46079.1 MAG: polyketide cyclase [Betaproteobacteria bacterium]